ncbi:MAG: tyrosine-type recombinase/integrase [Desulfobacterium sp.]|nr:tyrosine-type recombinase/integrase [Desulfobacterium sp.]
MKERSQLIEQLVYEMQLRNYSPRTIDTYGKVMSKLEKFSGIALDKITIPQFKDYLHRLITTEGISVSLVNQYLSAFKILQVDVLKRNWDQFKIKRPRREKKLPVVLSVQEVERIISVTSNIKHKTILMLAYSSGMRRQEVKQIKPSAIDSSRMQVHVVQGKGKKDRYTILSAKALEWLRTYYKVERPLTFLFEPLGKKGSPMGDQTLAHIVKSNARKAGIKKNISFHTLRHSFATHLLEQGVNLRLIQQFMGHVSLKTTAGYLHLVHIDPASVVSPLDKMNV